MPVLTPLTVVKLSLLNVVVVPNTTVGLGRLAVNVVDMLAAPFGLWPTDRRSSHVRPRMLDLDAGRKARPFMMIGTGLPPATSSISM